MFAVDGLPKLLLRRGQQESIWVDGWQLAKVSQHRWGALHGHEWEEKSKCWHFSFTFLSWGLNNIKCFYLFLFAWDFEIQVLCVSFFYCKEISEFLSQFLSVWDVLWCWNVSKKLAGLCSHGLALPFKVYRSAEKALRIPKAMMWKSR